MRHAPVHDYARVALAAIRIFNGGAALLAPRVLTRRLGPQADANPGSVYAFRMFGIRTVLIGADLLSPDPAVRRHAVRAALVVHASDTMSAAAAGLTRQLPPRAAVTTTAISSLNLLLSLLARRDAGRRE